MTQPLVGSEVFPPIEKYTYFDAASVGLMHKGAAEAINRWQRSLAEDGTVAFDETAEVEVLERLNRRAAALFHVEPSDIAVASSETALMASLAWAVMPPVATVDSEGGVSVTGTARMHEPIPERGVVSLPIRDVFDDGRYRRRLGIYRHPRPRGELSPVTRRYP